VKLSLADPKNERDWKESGREAVRAVTTYCLSEGVVRTAPENLSTVEAVHCYDGEMYAVCTQKILRKVNSIISIDPCSFSHRVFRRWSIPPS
jgi:hypothetical protein